jgi:HEPN domain-containing protein
MTRERFAGDDPREWLQRARSNLQQARVQHPDVYLEDLCFQAQQAAEKAVKALLLHYNIPFPYTHDISMLVSLVESHVQVPEELQEVVILTQYAVATRYPGVIEPVSTTEYLEALELADMTLRWAEDVIFGDSQSQEQLTRPNDL